MNKVVIGIVSFVLITSCSDKKVKEDSIITSSVDLIVIEGDSLMIESEILEPMRDDVNESFEDFIYNFTSDKSLQVERINFPLSYYNNGVIADIEQSNWAHDDLFTADDYYTLLFDKEDDFELIGDTSLNAVQVEWIYLQELMIKKYFFIKDRGEWRLDSLDYRPIVAKEREGFIDFLAEFSSDSTFQASRVAKPLVFVTADPDDDFSIIETSLDLNQWFAFKPELPLDKMSNINYGQRSLSNSNKKILALKGISNGFSNILYFKRKSKDSGWLLYKFEDVSI